MKQKGSHGCLKKLAKSEMKSERSYNLVIIVMIVAAICLTMAISLFFSERRTAAARDIERHWQAAFALLDRETAEKVKNSPEVEAAGEAFLLEEKKFQDYQVNIRCFDDQLWELNRMSPSIGRIPRTEGEAAVSADYLKRMGLKEQTGQRITVDMGGDGLMEFEVCGIFPADSDTGYYNIYISKDEMGKRYGDVSGTVYLRFQGTKGLPSELIRETAYRFAKNLGIRRGSVVFSTYYFTQLEKSSVSQTMVVLVAGGIILLAGSLVIYSIFYIAVTGKVRGYAQLRILGATERQIRKIINLEKRRLFLTAAPVGILLGGIAGFLILPEGWDLGNALKVAVIVLAAVYMTVSLSMKKPMKIAAKAPLVEVSHITTTTGKKQEKKRHKKLTPYRLAMIYFGQDRKKTTATILAMGFSGILLMGCVTYLFAVRPENMADPYFKNGQFKLRLLPEENDTNKMLAYEELQKKNPLDETLKEQLLALDGVTDIKTETGCDVRLTLPIGDEGVYLINGISPEEARSLTEYMIDGNCEYEKLGDNGLLVSQPELFEEVSGWKVKIGDTIWIVGPDEEKHAFQVVGTLGTILENESRGLFHISDSALKKICPEVENFNNQFTVKVKESSLEDVEEAIRSILKDRKGIELGTYDEMVKRFSVSLQNMKAPLLGLVAIVTFFALISLFNTIMANFLVRKKEYAMLQAVGMTGKQLTQLLYMEGLMYSICFLLITAVIGTGVSLLICKFLNMSTFYGKVVFRLPVGYLMLYFGSVILLQMLFSSMAVKRYQREALYEKIRGRE